MGVPHVWIIDPISREIWTVTGHAGPVPLDGTELMLPNTPVCIPVAEIFAEIDEAPPAQRFVNSSTSDGPPPCLDDQSRGALQPFRGSRLSVTGREESLDLPQLFEALRRRLARERL